MKKNSFFNFFIFSAFLSIYTAFLQHKNRFLISTYYNSPSCISIGKMFFSSSDSSWMKYLESTINIAQILTDTVRNLSEVKIGDQSF